MCLPRPSNGSEGAESFIHLDAFNLDRTHVLLEPVLVSVFHTKVARLKVPLASAPQLSSLEHRRRNALKELIVSPYRLIDTVKGQAPEDRLFRVPSRDSMNFP